MNLPKSYYIGIYNERSDSVVMPYDEINQIIVNFMESKGIPVPEVKDHR